MENTGFPNGYASILSESRRVLEAEGAPMFPMMVAIPNSRHSSSRAAFPVPPFHALDYIEEVPSNVSIVACLEKCFFSHTSGTREAFESHYNI